MSVAQDIQNQIDAIKAQVASGELSAADAVELLKELKDVQKSLGTAEAEVAVRLLVEAAQVLSKL
jgi:hypothetical protein